MKSIVIKRKTSIIGENFYIIFITLAMLSMYLGIRNGVISSILILIVAFDTIRVSYSNQRIELSITALWVLVFTSYNILTITYSIAREYPLSIILSEGANNILPIVFFFYAKKISHKEEKNFEKKVLVSALILILTGIYYNVNLNDPYYISFLHEAYPRFSMNWFIKYPRLTSWVGSVNIGVILNVALGFTFVEFAENKNFKMLIFWILNLSLGIVLTMQRSAILVLAINLFFILVYLKKHRLIKRYHILSVLIILVAFVFMVSATNPEIIFNSFERIISMNNAVSERSNDWLLAFDNGFMTLTGVGLATGGQRAIGVVENTINDGNYFKMIYETGLIGLMFFFIIISRTIYSGLKNYKVLGVYLIIILGFLLQAVGSNILTFQFSAPLCWYCIGIIDKNKNQFYRNL